MERLQRPTLANQGLRILVSWKKNPSGNEDIIPAPTRKRMQCYRAIALSLQPPSECSGARLAIRSGAPQLQSTAL